MDYSKYAALGIALPFLGTALGAAAVFMLKNELGERIRKLLIGFASGVMIAASVWSLLIPAIDMETKRGGVAWIPAVSGFLIGIAFLLLLDRIIAKLDPSGAQGDISKSASEDSHHIKKSAMLVTAVTLHNFPEGMAVGVVFAGLFAGTPEITVAGALALSIGIAVQNFPEGAIISMPLAANGMKKPKAFLCGVLSGAVEPVGAVMTLLLTSLVSPVLPYILSFAAGAMIYVVIEELIPEAKSGTPSYLPTTGAAIGFALMMLLDVALG